MSSIAEGSDLRQSLTVEADKLTLTPEDLARVTDLLKLRPMQMALFLKALVGTEEMRRMMVEAIKVAKQVQSGGLRLPD